MTEQALPPRHAQLEALCGRLESILWGRAAEVLLPAEEAAAEGAQRLGREIVLLPAWDWRRPAMDVGRKGVDHSTGGELLMPVRLDWGGNPGLVRIEESGVVPAHYSWSARSMGWTDTGKVAPDRVAGDLGFEAGQKGFRPGGLVATIRYGNHRAPGGSRFTVRSLRDLVNSGRESQWQLLFSLEPFVTSIVRKAHSAVSHEIGEMTGRFQPVLHETGIEQIVNEMMLGEPATEGARLSSVARLLEQCLDPDRFAKVDPLMFLRRNIRRDAEDHVRRAIGDPRIGPKVRRVARQNPGASLDEVIGAYRREYPGDRLSEARATAALQVGSDPMARTLQLDSDTNGAVR